MSQPAALNSLWETAPTTGPVFDPADIQLLPESARRYLEHSIAPGTPLAFAARLHMYGGLRLKNWYPFKAEQIIRWDGEMLWQATVRMRGIPITGFDALLRGEGQLQWKLLGLFPFLAASGPDVTRSTIGRVLGESVWLPSLLCREAVTWTAPDAHHAHATLSLLGERVDLKLEAGATGRLQSMAYQRWGNPGGSDYHYATFGDTWKRKQRSAATPGRAACVSAGISAPTASNPTVSSSASRSMRQSFGERLAMVRQTELGCVCNV